MAFLWGRSTSGSVVRTQDAPSVPTAPHLCCSWRETQGKVPGAGLSIPQAGPLRCPAPGAGPPCIRVRNMTVSCLLRLPSISCTPTLPWVSCPLRETLCSSCAGTRVSSLRVPGAPRGPGQVRRDYSVSDEWSRAHLSLRCPFSVQNSHETDA